MVRPRPPRSRRPSLSKRDYRCKLINYEDAQSSPPTGRSALSLPSFVIIQTQSLHCRCFAPPVSRCPESHCCPLSMRRHRQLSPTIIQQRIHGKAGSELSPTTGWLRYHPGWWYHGVLVCRVLGLVWNLCQYSTHLQSSICPLKCRLTVHDWHAHCATIERAV